ncbi:MAG: MATE family efflux transporter [Ruminococcaceae bacterium]|nr:MATE family efflux transporter [Oscillospiraceae bacterium]
MNKSSLTEGSVFGALFRFSLPMIVINILQMLFHMADTATLGVMAGDMEVAAVGACGSLVSLLLCLVTGYSGAANVVISRRIGAGDRDGARRACGVALVMGLLSGLILMVIVLAGSRQFLILMNCQPEVLDMADLYLKIYFLGMPITMLYNFATSILRASGDSVRPMIYMIVSGVTNVGLNVLFVGVFDMTVSGVACATVISNVIALTLALIALAKDKDFCKIELRNLRLRRAEVLEIVRIGVPSCIAGISFYFGEVVVVSAVNSLGTNAMTANAVSAQIDRINYTVGASIASAGGVMISQNFGAKRFDRIRRVLTTTALYCIGVTMLIGVVAVLLSDVLIGFYTDSAEIVELTKGRLVLVCLTNFITCTMEVFSHSVSALKRPNTLLVVGLTCGFAVRSGWAWFIWPLCPTLPFLFICFPLSTLIGGIIHFTVYRGAIRKEELAATGTVAA